MDPCRVIHCEKQSCGCQDNSLTWTILDTQLYIKKYFTHIAFVHVSSRHAFLQCKTQEGISNSAVASRKSHNYLKWTEGKPSCTGHKLCFLGALGEETAVVSFR